MKKNLLRISLIVLFCNINLFSQKIDSPDIRLTLNEIISLNLQNSRTIKNLYLTLKSQKADLYTSEGKFIPIFTVGSNLGAGLDMSKSGDNYMKTFSNQLGLTANVTIKMPTGASISYTWEGTASRNQININDLPDNSTDTYLKQGGVISVIQPLLKGGGIDVTRASIDLARLSDSINIQNLKSSFMDNITNLIMSYRNLLLAEKQLQIAEFSLKTAKELDTLNRALAKTGIIAENETIQNETQVAYAEIQKLQAQNSLENARLNLINILDVDPKFQVLAKDETVPKYQIDSITIFNLALNNSPTYLNAVYNSRIADIRYRLAKDNKLIDLNLFANYNNSTNGATPYQLQNRWQLGVNFSYTFNDLSRDQYYEQSMIAVDQAENILKKTELGIRLQITNTLKDIALKFHQVELANKLKDLSEKKLSIEKEKMKIGKSSTFQIISFQNDLVSAQNNQISAIVQYLNALTTLDQIIGTSLDTYGIKLELEKNLLNKIY
jgi:outer membrane protein TolC